MAAVDATIADVKLLAPELADESDPRITLALSLAAARLSKSYLDTNYQMAQQLLAAHLLTMMNQGGSAGQVISEKAGDLSVTYAGVSTSSGGGLFSGSSYGEMLAELLATLNLGPGVTGPDVLPLSSDDLGLY